MIKYTKEASHNFLDSEWSKKFREVGILMEDASWWIVEDPETHEKIICDKDEVSWFYPDNYIFPTYTLPDLIYKLSGWIHAGDNKFSGPLGFIKEEPIRLISDYDYIPLFAWTYYNIQKRQKDYYTFKDGKACLESRAKTPIIAAAQLLLKVALEGVEFVKDIRDIYKK